MTAEMEECCAQLRAGAELLGSLPGSAGTCDPLSPPASWTVAQGASTRLHEQHIPRSAFSRKLNISAMPVVLSSPDLGRAKPVTLSSNSRSPWKACSPFTPGKTYTKTSSQRDGSACLRVFGDNRCLFRALIRQFSREFDGPRDLWGKSFGAGIERSERSAADQLRDKVCDYMDDHVATLQHPADIFGGRDPDEYIAWMRVRST